MDFEPFRAFQVVFGIGLVIFVHELGHFLAARLCKVRVETFSLGFGPRLFGRRIGATMYQIAIVPLGGYCRMAGEERRWDGLEPRPDELPAKSVEARFFIYSAGVLMNVLFVLVVFPILFSVGVPFLEPRIGVVAPGSPAWHAGVELESDVLSVNGEEVFEFAQIGTEIAMGEGDVELVVRTPGSGEERTFLITPELDPRFGIPTIGVGPALVRDELGRPVLHVTEDSPAWMAGVRTGDRLLAVVDGAPGLPALEQYERAIQAGGPVRLRFVDEGGEHEAEILPGRAKESVPRVGIAPAANHVQAIRKGSLPDRLGLRENDRLLRVNGVAIHRDGDLLRALEASLGADSEFVLRRSGTRAVLDLPALEPSERRAFLDDLVLAPDTENNWIVVMPGEAAAERGLRDGDRVLKVDQAEVSAWAGILEGVRAGSSKGRPIRFRVERIGAPDADPVYLDLEVSARDVPLSLYGIGFQSAQYTYRSENVLEAIRFGFYSSWKIVNELWFGLKGLVAGDLKVSENLAGPITIAQVSYSWAEGGWPRFFFFLCFISMNLAVLNVLPIPVLDGGHLFFLIVEKIKGSPVSDRVLGYSQMVGVVLLLSLMVYVTYNDIVRMFTAGT